MRFSVPGYNICDPIGVVLYDGEIVRRDWGGGNDGGRPYRVCAYHQLSISPRGKLTLVGYDNHVNSTELHWISEYNLSYLKHGLNKPFRVYI